MEERYPDERRRLEGSTEGNGKVTTLDLADGHWRHAHPLRQLDNGPSASPAL